MYVQITSYAVLPTPSFPNYITAIWQQMYICETSLNLWQIIEF